MPLNLTVSNIGYGEAFFRAFKDTDNNQYYQADRIPSRGLMDFGKVQGGTRVGMQLNQNKVNFPMLIKSICAFSADGTSGALLFEVFTKPGQGTANRYIYQSYGKDKLPMVYPELLLFPNNIVYVTPEQNSRVLLSLEPTDFVFHAQTHYASQK